VIVVFGTFIGKDQASWVGALTYITALLLTSASMHELSTQYTLTYRFLPQVTRFMNLVRAQRSDPSAAPGPALDGIPVMERRTDVAAEGWRQARAGELSSLEGAASNGRAPRLALEHARLFCLLSEPVDRLTLNRVLDPLAHSASVPTSQLRSHAYFCGDAPVIPATTLGRVAAGGREPEPAERERILAIISLLGLGPELDALPAGLDTVLDPTEAREFSSELRYAVAVIPGLLDEDAVLVLGWRTLSKLERTFRGRLMEVAGTRPVILVASTVPRQQPREAQLTVVIDKGEVLGAGDAGWHARVAPMFGGGRQGPKDMVDSSAEIEELLEKEE
jgi:hypothetical protein